MSSDLNTDISFIIPSGLINELECIHSMVTMSAINESQILRENTEF